MAAPDIFRNERHRSVLLEVSWKASSTLSRKSWPRFGTCVSLIIGSVEQFLLRWQEKAERFHFILALRSADLCRRGRHQFRIAIRIAVGDNLVFRVLADLSRFLLMGKSAPIFRRTQTAFKHKLADSRPGIQRQWRMAQIHNLQHLLIRNTRLHEPGGDMDGQAKTGKAAATLQPSRDSLGKRYAFPGNAQNHFARGDRNILPVRQGYHFGNVGKIRFVMYMVDCYLLFEDPEIIPQRQIYRSGTNLRIIQRIDDYFTSTDCSQYFLAHQYRHLPTSLLFRTVVPSRTRAGCLQSCDGIFAPAHGDGSDIVAATPPGHLRPVNRVRSHR